VARDRYAQYGAASGLVAVLALFVGFGIFGADIPDFDAPAADWSTFYADNADQVQLGATILGVGLFFFVWFLGSLRAALATAEGGTGRLSSVAFGGGLLGSTFVIIGMSAALAASLRAGPDVDPAITQALNDVNFLTAAPIAGAFTAMFAATAIVGYRHRPFGAPIAGFAALAALGQPFAFAIAFTDDGVWAADGALGLYVPVVTFGISTVLLSLALMRNPSGTPATPAAQ
jgi:hypothetical protein